ncbi:hypothetical protein IHE44_0007479, partial [Lamprotornis superbus]
PPGCPRADSPSRGAPTTLLPSVPQRSPGEERERPVEGRETRLRVVLRVRPLTYTETRRGDQQVVHSLGDGAVHVSAARHDATFGFSAVFDAGASQEAVFEGSGMRQLVELAMDGFSCTVFAFGQTGSGKTYTLMGPLVQSEAQPASPALLGLMQRSFTCLLEEGRSRGSDLALSASYLEIYNEQPCWPPLLRSPGAFPLPCPQVRDLLSPGPPCALPLRWSKTRGFYVENQLSVEFESLEAIVSLLLQGTGLGHVQGVLDPIWEDSVPGWWRSDGSHEEQLLVLLQSQGRLVSGRGWWAVDAVGIPEAPDLGTCPQQALEPQPRPSDHPHPPPNRERASCSWGGLGDQGSARVCKQSHGVGESCSPQGYTGGAGVSSQESYPRSRSRDSAVEHGEGVMGAKASPPNTSACPSKQGTLCFVDLAGSERVKETGSSGELSVEANSINRSLLALGDTPWECPADPHQSPVTSFVAHPPAGHCISLLAKPRGKRTHIPYRDSKLTRLLARSLGGSGITLMVKPWRRLGRGLTPWRGGLEKDADSLDGSPLASLPRWQVACISPSSRCLSETLSTLHYASRARRVTTRPLANRVSREKLLQTLEQEIHALQLENLSLRQQLCLPRMPVRSTEVKGSPPKAWAGSGDRYGPAGQLPPKRTPAWPSLYGLLRDFVVENEQMRYGRLVWDP